VEIFWCCCDGSIECVCIVEFYVIEGFEWIVVEVVGVGEIVVVVGFLEVMIGEMIVVLD